MPSSPRSSRASTTAGSHPRTWRERSELDLYGAALAHFNLARNRPPGEAKVRVYNPQFEVNGWQSTHTAVEIVTDDMPFLIDSVSMELNRRGFGVHMIIHPVLNVRRDADGRLSDPAAGAEAPDGAIRESVIHAEVDAPDGPEAAARPRRSTSARDQRGARGGRGLAGDARRRPSRAGRGARREPPPLDPVRSEAGAFLDLARGPITSPSWATATTTRAGRRRAAARRDPGAGLGILRQTDDASSRSLDDLPREVRERALERYLLNLTKANTRADRAPRRVPRLRGRQALRREGRVGRAALPRPLHAHRLPREPARDPDPAPQGRRASSSAPPSRPAATTRRR